MKAAPWFEFDVDLGFSYGTLMSSLDSNVNVSVLPFLYFKRVNISGLHRFFFLVFPLLALLKFFICKTLTKYQSFKAIAAHSGLYMTPKIVFISHPTPPPPPA
jgi:hypothetical protein